MRKVGFVLVLLLAFLLPSAFAAAAGGTTETVTTVVDLYDSPSFSSKTEHKLAPQPVSIVEKWENGWWKIKTWLGDKWIVPNGVTQELTKTAMLHHTPSLLDKAGVSVAPQYVSVMEQTADGWWKIKTWLGDKWVAPSGVKQELTRIVQLYNTPSLSDAAGAAVAPQPVRVLDEHKGGWWKIKTWLGTKWILPNGSTKQISVVTELYDSPSYSSKSGYSLAPQSVRVVDENNQGWWKVQTWLGDKWIAPLQELHINTSTNKMKYYQNGELVKEFSIATGKSATPTPKGTYMIVNKIVNRPYYTGGIPGGDPRNPLGDRWLGLNINGTWGTTYAIHGNSNSGSIGQNISSGCIRMYNEDIHWLFGRIQLYSKVVIQ